VADVRRALEAFTSDDALETSPLAVGHAGPNRAESVRARLRSAADVALSGSPHAAQLKAIVDRRFLIGCDAHDAIARSLPVSRATYFRRLSEAVDLIAGHLLDQDA
jgi:plasmid stabilization system protein ParE